MPDLPRAHLAAYAIAALAVVVLGARWVHAGGARGAAAIGVTPSGAASAPSGSSTRVSVARAASGAGATVHVAGEVRRPGVYHLSASARVQDAVRRAGGATRRADLNGLNLAAKLEDGRQIVVPARASAGSGASPGSASTEAGGGAVAEPPVNLNTATLEQLGTLDGVGPATAQKILDYRMAHGGFGSVDDLDGVPGIGPKRLAALREHVTT